SNAFVPFTLVHEGEDIPIRNHDGDTIDFDFERGFIEHGKALTTEAVLRRRHPSNVGKEGRPHAVGIRR
ncbi:MAG: hypothetical protein HYY06_25500, partial [Deltaproteobacteria bacterium]|nr:hypothetical protein [Deltaproteobacteria bacterium]